MIATVNTSASGTRTDGSTRLRTTLPATSSAAASVPCDHAASRSVFAASSSAAYTANGSWADGDGGGTGLFTTQAAGLPLARVPPLNNSLLLFACTPGSFRTFMVNRRERNSLIMWLQADRDDVVRRYGESSLVPFAVHK